jgi:hypothetical protein
MLLDKIINTGNLALHRRNTGGRYNDSLETGRSGVRTPVGSEICRNCPNRSCGPTSLLHDGYRGFFQGVKWLGRGVDHPPSSVDEIRNGYSYTCTPLVLRSMLRGELYLHRGIRQFLFCFVAYAPC